MWRVSKGGVASLAILLVSVALTGCIGGTGEELDPTAADRAAEDLDHLDASGADVAETRGDMRVFAWNGIELGPSASAPLFGPIGPLADTAELTFEIDETVGYIELAIQVTGGTQAFLLDDEGGIQCGTAASDGEAACTGVYALPDGNVTTWTASLTSTGPEGAVVDVTATLHPRSHLEAKRLAAQAVEDHLAPEGPSFANIELPSNGAEPTLGVLGDGTIFYMAGTTMYRSQDGGDTWDDVSPLLNSQISLDPMMRADPWTHRVFADQLTVACSNIAWTDDKGGSWVEHPLACGEPANDHQKLAVGGHPVSGNPVFDGVVYYSFNSFTLLAPNAGHLTVSRSLDGGVTWQPVVAMTEAEAGNYRTGGPIEADRSGNVYVPSYHCDGGLLVTASNDYGLTWETHRVGDQSGACEGIDPGMTVDVEGGAYTAWWGEGHIWASASSDNGATWTDQVAVSPEGLQSQVLVDAAAGDPGRVAVAYLATPHSDAGPNGAPGYAEWHLYMSYTEDAFADNATWQTVRVTPDDDPVQIGSICTGGIGCFGGNRNLLDFIDIQPGPDGRVHIAYADGCTTGEDSACVDPPSSRSRAAVIAIQDDAVDGFRLFEDGAPWGA